MFSRERCSAAPPVRCATRVHVRAWPSCTGPPGAARLRMGRCCVLAHLTASTCESFRRYSKYIARAIYRAHLVPKNFISKFVLFPLDTCMKY